MLAGGSHALLAGRSVNDPDAPVPFARGPRNIRGGQGPGMGAIAGGPVRRADTEAPPPRTLDLRQIAAVQNVSLAFLDATLRSSPAGRQWLEQQARAWLNTTGTLSAR
jgi:hypothetical protein